MRAWLALALRGMAMGLAEVVPGVSGGTIALVTGIYDELVGALAALRLESIRLLLRDGFVRLWRVQNLSFLTVLGVGMLVSILVFARLFAWLIDVVAPVVWAFFFGLIVASIVRIGRDRPARLLASAGCIGLIAGLALKLLEPGSADAGPLWFAVGGFIAISAWLLPAISGSFMLLVLGLYEPVLRAVGEFDLALLAVFLGGCVVGVLTMARLLHWLMQHYREGLLALLTGFMAGSLASLWPWQVDGSLVSPAIYQSLAGTPAYPGYSVLAAVAGMVALWLLARFE